MKKTKEKRFELLEALIDYADQSDASNPHFYKDEMLKKLNVTEGEFNIIQKQLGDEYCQMRDIHNGRSRYAINIAKCLVLRGDTGTAEKRHSEIVSVTALSAVLGALVGFIVGRCSV